MKQRPGPAKGVMTEEIGHYLDQCQLLFKPALDQVDAQTHTAIVKSLITAIKATPWYLGGWEDLARETWFK